MTKKQRASILAAERLVPMIDIKDVEYCLKFWYRGCLLFAPGGARAFGESFDDAASWLWWMVDPEMEART